MPVAFVCLAVSSLVLPSAPQRPPSVVRRCGQRCSSIRAAVVGPDGEEVDWDKEAAALVARTGGVSKDNKFYDALRAIPHPELVAEFASTAPRDVQVAVRATIGQLLGQLPPEFAESTITTTGKALGSLMFSMQMTGYMFRNAEYRRSLKASLDTPGDGVGGALATEGESGSADLPPVSGTITVRIGEGMEAQVDAAAYMAELRSEVEGLRSEIRAKEDVQADAGPAGPGGGLISYIQALDRDGAQQLTSEVGEEVLEAMSQLVSSLMRDINVPYDEAAEVQATAPKLRELLITQLVAGYKLRELEVREGLKDKFWGADGSKGD